MEDLFNNEFSSSDKQNEQRDVIAFIHVLIMLTMAVFMLETLKSSRRI